MTTLLPRRAAARAALLAAPVAAAVLALAAACSGQPGSADGSAGSSTSSSGSSDAAGRGLTGPAGRAPRAASPPSPVTAGEDSGDVAGGGTGRAGGGGPSGSEGGASGSSSAGGGPGGAVLEQPAIISTGSVSLRAADVARARAQVQRIAASYGGRVTDQDTATADDGRLGYARLTLRVPSASFARAMADLEDVGRLVDSSTTSTDVSTQVVDVDERVKAARASIERIRLLLARAERLGDIMSIESQLAGREADLNSLLRQQAQLADQTSLSTVSVDIERPASAPHTRRADDHTGFLAGLRGGWHALHGVATGAATVVGALLPWIPVALLVGLPAWLAVRRLRRTSAERPAGAGQASG